MFRGAVAWRCPWQMIAKAFRSCTVRMWVDTCPLLWRNKQSLILLRLSSVSYSTLMRLVLVILDGLKEDADFNKFMGMYIRLVFDFTCDLHFSIRPSSYGNCAWCFHHRSHVPLSSSCPTASLSYYPRDVGGGSLLIFTGTIRLHICISLCINSIYAAYQINFDATAILMKATNITSIRIIIRYSHPMNTKHSS